jgi:ADP-heptose:LPS heptosyltransferase
MPRLIVPTSADTAEAQAILTRAESSSQPVVIHPGAGWELKSWPVERWGALAHRLAEELGVRPLISGGPDEVGVAGAIVDASRGNAVSIAGTLSLGGLIGVLEQSRIVVANDGGPLHLAAALGTPVVGLYGPADPVEFGPWGTGQQRVVQASLPCQPCRTLDNPPCGARRLPACLLAVSVETVLNAALELLAQAEAASSR